MRHSIFTTEIVVTSLLLNSKTSLFCSACWTCKVEDVPQSSLLAHRNNLPCSELDQYTPIACDNIPRCKQAEFEICWVDRGISTDFDAECQLGYECVILDPEQEGEVGFLQNIGSSLVLPKISKQTGRCMKSTLFLDENRGNLKTREISSGSGEESGSGMDDYEDSTDSVVIMDEVVYDLDKIDSDFEKDLLSSGMIHIPEDEYTDYEYSEISTKIHKTC